MNTEQMEIDLSNALKIAISKVPLNEEFFNGNVDEQTMRQMTLKKYYLYAAPIQDLVGKNYPLCDIAECLYGLENHTSKDEKKDQHVRHIVEALFISIRKEYFNRDIITEVLDEGYKIKNSELDTLTDVYLTLFRVDGNLQHREHYTFWTMVNAHGERVVCAVPKKGGAVRKLVRDHLGMLELDPWNMINVKPASDIKEAAELATQHNSSSSSILSLLRYNPFSWEVIAVHTFSN